MGSAAGSAARVVMGPCPGCDAYGLEFDEGDVSAYEVEVALAEHVLECPPLARLLAEGRMSGHPAD